MTAILNISDTTQVKATKGNVTTVSSQPAIFCVNFAFAFSALCFCLQRRIVTAAMTAASTNPTMAKTATPMSRFLQFIHNKFFPQIMTVSRTQYTQNEDPVFDHGPKTIRSAVSLTINCSNKFKFSVVKRIYNVTKSVH